jgi:hypothetical protein
LVDFHEIQQGGNAIEGDHDATLFNVLLQPLQNGGHSHLWGGCKISTSQCGTMTFCILTEQICTWRVVESKNSYFVLW